MATTSMVSPINSVFSPPPDGAAQGSASHRGSAAAKNNVKPAHSVAQTIGWAANARPSMDNLRTGMANAAANEDSRLGGKWCLTQALNAAELVKRMLE
eukprot:CAMPEP_0198514168 /NCGR_PEP_ID=MMETSP1462-20131121/16524_1 /TAXON_ID=1333877 /ORGANISM="Brandtodinium nutriculum, Strain RCC3387" /LENGTH=97 /DNA_ID=CAMNT_0044243613 /DNA_START=127 /DNA_END=418 /DNA_ORIENTATION=+